jgi:hypothetical protein
VQVHKKGLVLQERGLPLQQLCVKLVDFGSAVHRLVCPTTMDVCCAGQCFLSRSRAVAWAGGMQKNWSLMAVVPLLFFCSPSGRCVYLGFPPSVISLHLASFLWCLLLVCPSWAPWLQVVEAPDCCVNATLSSPRDHHAAGLVVSGRHVVHGVYPG